MTHTRTIDTSQPRGVTRTRCVGKSREVAAKLRAEIAQGEMHAATVEARLNADMAAVVAALVPISQLDTADPDCKRCGGTGWVCENHDDKPWEGMTGPDPLACGCGAGMPCPNCNDLAAPGALRERGR